MAPVPVSWVSSRATAVSAAAAATRTGRGDRRSSSMPARGARAVIGTVTARKTEATAHEACDVWYTRLARATMASPSPAEIRTCRMIARLSAWRGVARSGWPGIPRLSRGRRGQLRPVPGRSWPRHSRARPGHGW